MASVASIANEYYNFQRETAAQLSALTAVVGANSAAALVFEDSKDAQATLAGLRTIPSVFFGRDSTREKGFCSPATNATREGILYRRKFPRPARPWAGERSS